MDHRMIIFGADGTLEKKLIELLKKEDVDLTVASRSLKNLPSGVKALQVDYGNPAFLERALAEKEILFLHLPLDQNFALSSRNILRAAKLNGVRFLLLVSGVGASSHSPYLWERTWGEWEEEVSHSKMRYCFLRTNLTMQHWYEGVKNELRSGSVVRPSRGEGRVALVDERDVAELAAKILLNPMIFHRQTLEVTGSRAYTLEEMIALVGFHADRCIGLNSSGVTSPPSLERSGDLGLYGAIAEGRFAAVSGHYEKIMGRDPRRFEDFCAEVGPTLHLAPASEITKIDRRLL